MKIFAAIDILDGKAVRLQNGCFDKETRYADSPLEAARLLQGKGAKFIHMVNLMGALSGIRSTGLGDENGLPLLISQIKALGLQVQFGGGIRSLEDCEYLNELGVSSMIVGTAATEDLEFLTKAVERFGDKITVAVDLKNGKPAIKGWMNEATIDLMDLCERLKQVGVQRIVYTEISRDGMLSGPDLEGLKNIQTRLGTSVRIVASGGISSLQDLRAISELGIEEAIIGSALYENRLDLRKAEVIGC